MEFIAALALMKQGKDYQTANKLDMAQDSYRQALSKNPRDNVIHETLANLLVKKNKHNEAIESYRESLKLKDNNKEVYQKIKDLYCSKKMYRDAEQYFRDSYKKNQRNTLAAYALGDVLIQSKQYPAAMQHYEKLLLKDSSDLISIERTGDILRLKQEYKNAIQYYKQVQDSQQKRNTSINHKIVQCLTNIIKKNPNDQWALSSLSTRYLKNNDLDKAKELAQKALSISPTNHHTLDILGDIHLYQNRSISKANQYYQSALKYSEGNPFYQYKIVHTIYLHKKQYQAYKYFLSYDEMYDFEDSDELERVQNKYQFSDEIISWLKSRYEQFIKLKEALKQRFFVNQDGLNLIKKMVDIFFNNLRYDSRQLIQSSKLKQIQRISHNYFKLMIEKLKKQHQLLTSKGRKQLHQLQKSKPNIGNYIKELVSSMQTSVNSIRHQKIKKSQIGDNPIKAKLPIIYQYLQNGQLPPTPKQLQNSYSSMITAIGKTYYNLAQQSSTDKIISYFSRNASQQYQTQNLLDMALFLVKNQYFVNSLKNDDVSWYRSLKSKYDREIGKPMSKEVLKYSSMQRVYQFGMMENLARKHCVEILCLFMNGKYYERICGSFNCMLEAAKIFLEQNNMEQIKPIVKQAPVQPPTVQTKPSKKQSSNCTNCL